MVQIVFFFFWKLGELINLETGIICTDTSWQKAPDTLIFCFDRYERKWVCIKLHEIPETFTMATFPKNEDEEEELWLRAYGRLKHRYIWAASGGISRENFAKLKNSINQLNHNRYNMVDF